jgi:hypothetical protein
MLAERAADAGDVKYAPELRRRAIAERLFDTRPSDTPRLPAVDAEDRTTSDRLGRRNAERIDSIARPHVDAVGTGRASASTENVGRGKVLTGAIRVDVEGLADRLLARRESIAESANHGASLTKWVVAPGMPPALVAGAVAAERAGAVESGTKTRR